MPSYYINFRDTYLIDIILKARYDKHINDVGFSFIIMFNKYRLYLNSAY